MFSRKANAMSQLRLTAPISFTMRRLKIGYYPWILAMLLAAGAFLAPGTPFIIDGGIYADMAKAMAENSALHIGGNGGVDGAPALTKYLTYARDGLVYPQYPSGYALLAAPFYAAFGVHGLMLMNALSFGVCIYLTHRLANRFYGARVARWAAAIFALATFAPTYAFAIWPHMASLALWLAAAFFAAKAAQTRDTKSAYGLLLSAGALIGAGINIRIDAVLLAVALFIWLRAFARPEDRLAPLALALGMAPGLLLAATLNSVKFGVFTPFTYNSSGDAADLQSYLPVMMCAGAVMAALWLFNIKTVILRVRTGWGLHAVGATCAAGIAAALLISPLREILWRMGEGAYVLVINLQAHDAYRQEGVAHNQYGHLLFWGYPKKALVQSLPYLPLILLPALRFLHGKSSSAVALCLLAIAAPIAFYSLNEWHGGGSYNMRYFAPSLPFIAILSAAALSELIARAGAPKRQTVLLVFAAAAGAYLLSQEIANASERLLTPISLYPQWLIAAVLTATLAAYLFAPKSVITARAACVAALIAISYGAAVNLYEEIGHEKTRAEQQAIGIDASSPIRPGSLVLTQLPLILREAEARGVSLMVGDERTAAEAARAAEAFMAAGRCVYFQNSSELDLVAPHLRSAVSREIMWAESRRFNRDPRLAFYTFEAQHDQCAF